MNSEVPERESINYWNDNVLKNVVIYKHLNSLPSDYSSYTIKDGSQNNLKN